MNDKKISPMEFIHRWFGDLVLEDFLPKDFFRIMLEGMANEAENL